MKKHHRAKFEITHRGKKTKYYTCSICGFRCWAFGVRDAHNQHKVHLTKHAGDFATDTKQYVYGEPCEQCIHLICANYERQNH
jgi:hypothetical protein